MKMQVTGWRHSKGDFDGVAYDNLTIYCISRLKAGDNQRGAAGIEMRCEGHLKEKLMKIEFNGVIPCEIETEAVATGKGNFQETVVSINPIVQKA